MKFPKTERNKVLKKSSDNLRLRLEFHRIDNLFDRFQIRVAFFPPRLYTFKFSI